MSHIWTAIAWRYPGSPAEKLVLLSLADQANDEGVAWPSHRYTAQRIYPDFDDLPNDKQKDRKRTIGKRVKTLIDEGWLSKQEQKRENGSQKSNTYLLLDPAATPDPESPENPSPEPQEPAEEEITPEDIYGAYPRKVGKQRALKAIKAAIKRGADPKVLMERTCAYARIAEEAEDKGKVCHPTTWFNQDRYENDDTEYKLVLKPRGRTKKGRRPARSDSQTGQAHSGGPGSAGDEGIPLLV